MEIGELFQILTSVNKCLPDDFYEYEVHDLIIGEFEKQGIKYHHEYYYKDNRFKMDFLLTDRIGLEIKCSSGNIPRLGTLELGLYFPLCSCLIFANYYPKSPPNRRLTIFQVSQYSGVQLRMPMKYMNKKGVKSYTVNFVGDWDGKCIQRSPWVKAGILEENLWQDFVRNYEAPKEAIQRMSFPR